MTVQIKYLNWDGFYAPTGVCNQRRDPDDHIQRAQLHLTRLGFYRGPCEGANTAEFKDALEHYRYYPNKPIVAANTDVTYIIGPSRGKTLSNKYQFKAAPDIDDQRIANADVLDEPTRKALDKLVPWPKPVKAPTGGATSSSTRVSRTRSGNPQLGGTLNADPLAVRIMEVPTDFDLFDRYACFKIKLSGYERIKSMLVRIYRNTNPNSDTPPPPSQMVYQEVLLEDDIRALPGSKPSGFPNPKHKKDAAALMRAKHWAPGDYFKMKGHGPYRVRIWISTNANAFDKYLEATRPALLAQIAQQHWEFDREMQTKRLAMLDEDAAAADPELSRVIVHDRSHDAEGSDPIWTTEDKSGVNMMVAPCTEHNAAYMDQAASRYFKPPAPWGAAGVTEDLLADPAGFYMNWWKKREGNVSFDAKYMRETLDEVLRYIMRQRQSLCCGRDSLAPQSIKDEALETLQAAEDELAGLKFSGYPYKETVEFCAAVAAMTEWISHKCRTGPERAHHQLQHKDPFGNDYRGSDVARSLGHERNIVARRTPDEPDSYATTLVTDADSNGCKAVFDGLGSGYSGRQNERVQRAIANSDIILIPSYRPLDEEFFTITRQVPVFLVGLIDLHYLNADAHRYTPWQFFFHDLFHTVAQDEPPQSAEQMWHWTKHHAIEAALSPPAAALREFKCAKGAGWQENGVAVDLQGLQEHGFRNDTERRNLCQAWHANAMLLHARRDAFADYVKFGEAGVAIHESFQKAYDIVLFCLLHEPIKTVDPNTPAPRSFPPSMPDPEDLMRRISDPEIINQIDDRARDYWFGPPSEVTDQVLGMLPTALDQIRGVIASGSLTTSREILHGAAPVAVTPKKVSFGPNIAAEPAAVAEADE